METHDELKARVRREQWLAARLRLATERLEGAQRERIWAIVEAHQSGLSIRQIASATGLSPSRVHQPLGSDEAREIPRWLSQQRGRDHSDHMRAGLNEPGPDPLVETFRPSSPDCAFCLGSRTSTRLSGGLAWTGGRPSPGGLDAAGSWPLWVYFAEIAASAQGVVLQDPIRPNWRGFCLQRQD